MKEKFSPYHTSCYLCQASAEKWLKAFLIWKGWGVKKVHDLSKLLDHCQEFDEFFSIHFDECELLNEYITEGRYPGDLPFENIVENDAKEAIEAAAKIENLVLNNIKFGDS